MAAVDITIKGIKEAVSKMDAYGKTVAQALNRELARSAIRIHRTAREEVPVDEDRLRASIRFTLNKKKHEAKVGTNVEYAPFVEFGTAPHFPPFGPILGWVKRNEKFRSLPKNEQWAIAEGIQRNIGRRGTRAQPYLEPAFNAEKKRLIKNVGIAIKAAEPKTPSTPGGK